MPDLNWITIAEKSGIPCFLLLVVFWGIYQAFKYFLNRVAEPLTAKHLQTMDALQADSKKIVEAQSMNMSELRDIKTAIDTQTVKIVRELQTSCKHPATVSLSK